MRCEYWLKVLLLVKYLLTDIFWLVCTKPKTRQDMKKKFSLGETLNLWTCFSPLKFFYVGINIFFSLLRKYCFFIICIEWCPGLPWMQCSAVQCSAVQCSAVQCSAVQCSAVQCSVDSGCLMEPPGNLMLCQEIPAHSSPAEEIGVYGHLQLRLGDLKVRPT